MPEAHLSGRDDHHRDTHEHEHDTVDEHGQGHGHDHGHEHGHDHDHGHGHAHVHAPRSLKALLAVIALTTIIFLAEAIFGWLSNSLALLADAAHMLSDSAGLIIALVAMLIGRKKANQKATYGFRRVEVLAAAINATTLVIISIWIVVEAFARIGSKEHIQTTMMLVTAAIGLGANVISALLLVSKKDESMNMRGAYLHVLSDVYGSLAVIVAGFIVRYTDFVLADTIASVFISTLILRRSWALLKDALEVLLEQVPAGVDIDEVRATLEGIEGVDKVHDLHVWSTDGNLLITTAHLVIDSCAGEESHCHIIDDADAKLKNLGIDHSTLQIETVGHNEHEQDLHR